MRIRTETNAVGEQEKRISEIANALAHPVRIALINYLRNKNCGKGVDNHTCNKDLVEIFPYSQSTISQHVKILKDAGIFLTENKEKYTFYSLNPAAMKELADFLKV